MKQAQNITYQPGKKEITHLNIQTTKDPIQTTCTKPDHGKMNITPSIQLTKVKQTLKNPEIGMEFGINEMPMILTPPPPPQNGITKSIGVDPKFKKGLLMPSNEDKIIMDIIQPPLFLTLSKIENSPSALTIYNKLGENQSKKTIYDINWTTIAQANKNNFIITFLNKQVN